MRRIIVAAVVTAMLLVGNLPAQAHRQAVEDANDTRGKLDIKKAILNHDDTTVVLILRTYERWRSRLLREARGAGRVSFIFKNGPESQVIVDIKRRSDRKLWAAIVFCNPSGCDYDNAVMKRAYRPGRRSVRVRVRRELLPQRPVLRWYADTAAGRGCDGNCYFDSAPDTPRLARHEVGP